MHAVPNAAPTRSHPQPAPTLKRLPPSGIQHMFEGDPNVLYFSVHRYERGHFFPGTSDASARAVGRGAGAGLSVNVGWNTRGFGRPGDAEYAAVWDEILMPIATHFDPELVIVAAGFDAAEGDPLGGCHVTPAGYARLTEQLLRCFVLSHNPFSPSVTPRVFPPSHTYHNQNLCLQARGG